jgi:hypothetical protein
VIAGIEPLATGELRVAGIGFFLCAPRRTPSFRRFLRRLRLPVTH